MKLQFKDQTFQSEATQAVCDVFEGQPCQTAALRRAPGDGQQSMEVCHGNHPLAPGLSRAKLLSNLREVQRRNGLPPSEELSGPGINLTIEMETGTGKTYTYIKTMYELNALYGWSKFIIVVPSVAIREGVYKSLQSTQEHFAGKYGKKIRSFIYNSERLHEVDRFAADHSIQVMVINMQAFNSSKNQRVIDRKADAFRSRRPIDIIAETNPILILDEPQSMGGEATKKSLEKFSPLFTLRYSATHREKYDMIYRLDAMDAYNKHLVKRIAALSVTLTGEAGTGYLYLEGVDRYVGKNPVARLGFKLKGSSGIRTVVKKVGVKGDLYELSGHLDDYADRYILTDIDGETGTVTMLNGLKLQAGQILGNEELTALQRRIQIRETIRTHLARERELYARGIKVLSLFFIDEVKHYRDYEGGGESGRNGLYAQMFEEEYDSLVSELQPDVGEEAYFDYLKQLSAAQTHKGYFSVDRKRGKQPKFVDSKVDRKTQSAEDADAYNLIMKEKERLLSFSEPVRFIFSHSALREGWDNPNVFQICTLKKQSESDVRSRQEIGRGLRLCVNQRGERMDESVLGKDVQKLNKLTVITDLSFAAYAKGLQLGLADAMADRPKKVEMALFRGRDLVSDRGETIHVTEELAEIIYEDLIANGYVRRGELTDLYRADKAAGQVQVAQEVAGCEAAVIAILASLYDGRALQPEDARANNVQGTLRKEQLESKYFQGLWERIRHKSYYTVSFDTEELIEEAIKELNDKLEVAHIFVRRDYGEQAESIRSKEQLQRGEGFAKTNSVSDRAEDLERSSVRYDLVGRLTEETGLTRGVIAAILRGLTAEKFGLFKENPEGFLQRAAALINDQKAEAILKNITYGKLEESHDLSLFTGSVPKGRLGGNAVESRRGLYDYLVYDSDNEKAFAAELDVNEKVAVYVKLPGSFFISTPVGTYNPDWAIAFYEDGVKHIYVVAETKGSRDEKQLRGVEKAKLACARAHFAAISGGDVLYQVVDNCDTLLELIS